jgi:hypothetical protein
MVTASSVLLEIGPISESFAGKVGAESLTRATPVTMGCIGSGAEPGLISSGRRPRSVWSRWVVQVLLRILIIFGSIEQCRSFCRPSGRGAAGCRLQVASYGLQVEKRSALSAFNLEAHRTALALANVQNLAQIGPNRRTNAGRANAEVDTLREDPRTLTCSR